MKPLSRRQFFTVSGTLCGTVLLANATAHGQNQGAPFRRTSKEVFIPSANDTGVFPGFVTYIDKDKPTILHRSGWVDASDTYDNFSEMTSFDNGVTWTEPKMAVKAIPVDGGLIRFIENAAYFDEDSGVLTTFVSKSFYPNGKFDSNQARRVLITRSIPKTGKILDEQELDFGRRSGVSVSFTFPIKTTTGRLIVPVFSAQTNDAGEFVHHPVSKTNIYETYMMLGDPQSDGSVKWSLSEAIKADDERSTRGFSESTPVQLNDGRIATLSRGSNARAKDTLPGYKWLCFSKDDGSNWSEPMPMTCSDGSEIESSATGSALIRSVKNGKLYFVGNLCADGKRADGNWPRSPLHIAEVDESTVSIIRDSITIIDQRDDTDTDRTQISNFRYYQDRETNEIVIFATRFGENETKNWKRADYYRYRVAIID
ncbi:MAG: sialidase family protein [Candidatus Hydrogenedentota bacterium]